MAEATGRARRRWGSAGVLDGARRGKSRATGEVAGPDRARVTGIVAEQRDEQQMRMARTAWQTGQLIPDRVTMALDLRELEGPQVDEACLAAEPDVDRWEAGDLYPSWEQLLALAELTGFHPRFFALPASPKVRWQDTSMRFHAPAEKKLPPQADQLDLFPVRDPDGPQVLRFTTAALAEAAERYSVRPTSVLRPADRP